MLPESKVRFWDMLGVYIFLIYITGIAYTLVYLGTFGLKGALVIASFIVSVIIIGLGLTIPFALKIIKEVQIDE